VKSLTRDRAWGVAVLAEGLIERLGPDDLARFPDMDRDDFGHVRLSDVRLGEWLGQELSRRMKARSLSMRFNEVKLGYELRSADPVPFDIEYTRDLGFAAVRFLAGGGSGAMVMIVNGELSSMPFSSLRDAATGRTRIRDVDIDGESYTVARRYMQRLNRKDFDDPKDVERLADAANCSADDFRAHFEESVQHEPLMFGWEDKVRDSIDF
jgi:6-phosphofructokinase 1